MKKKLLPFNNVVATGMATLSLANLLGFTVHRITLALGGTAFTKAMITGLRIKANGKIIFNDTGTYIDNRMTYRGITAAAGFLTIDFDEIRAKTVVGQQLGAIDTTFGIKDLTMEVDIAGATAPTLSGWAEVAAPQVYQNGEDMTGRGLIAKVLSFNHYFGAAGKFSLDIPYGHLAGSLIKRLHLVGLVTDVEFKKNGITIEETSDALNRFDLAEYARAPVAGIYTVDFIKDGNLSNTLNAANAQTMEYYATVSGAGNVIVIAELLDPLANN